MGARAHFLGLAVAALAASAMIALLASVGVSASPGSWSSTGSMFTPRVQHTATRLADGRVLVTGGINGDLNSVRGAEFVTP